MARKVDSTALIGLLQELASVKSTLGDEGVVVVSAEVSSSVKTSSNDADSLELCTTVANCLLVYSEGLREEFVSNFFVARLISDLAACNKEPEREVCCTAAGVQRAEEGVCELVKRRRLRIPVVVEMFARLEFPGELEGRGDESRSGIFDSLVAFAERFPCRLKELLFVNSRL